MACDWLMAGDYEKDEDRIVHLSDRQTLDPGR